MPPSIYSRMTAANPPSSFFGGPFESHINGQLPSTLLLLSQELFNWISRNNNKELLEDVLRCSISTIYLFLPYLSEQVKNMLLSRVFE